MRQRSGDEWLGIIVNVAVLGFLGYALLRPAGPIGQRWRSIRSEQHLREVIAVEWDRLSVGASTGLPTVVEFIDYECPYCRRAHGLLLDAQRDGAFEVVYRHLPLVIHPRAEGAARTVLCSERQHRSSRVHEMLLTTDAWRQGGYSWLRVGAEVGISDTTAFRERGVSI